jgi:RNA polymerase sigma-70 factor (ECF subfamily)
MPKAAREHHFRRIYDAEIRFLWSSLQRLGVLPGDLEDVAHDVLLNVYRKLDHYDASRPIRPWLFGFAYRGAADHRKRVRRRRELPGSLEEGQTIPDAAPNPDERLVGEEDRKLVVDALAQLPIERAAVFTMMDIDGHSAPEVSDALEIPINTVYSRLRVAREEFASAVRLISNRGGQR